MWLTFGYTFTCKVSKQQSLAVCSYCRSCLRVPLSISFTWIRHKLPPQGQLGLPVCFIINPCAMLHSSDGSCSVEVYFICRCLYHLHISNHRTSMCRKWDKCPGLPRMLCRNYIILRGNQSLQAGAGFVLGQSLCWGCGAALLIMILFTETLCFD